MRCVGVRWRDLQRSASMIGLKAARGGSLSVVVAAARLAKFTAVCFVSR
jgi:hypothetical protein